MKGRRQRLKLEKRGNEGVARSGDFDGTRVRLADACRSPTFSSGGAAAGPCMTARARATVFCRVLRRGVVLAALLGGAGIVLSIDVTMRLLCPPNTLPQNWRNRTRWAEVRKVVYAPGREATMLWFGAPGAEYLMNWSGAVAPSAAGVAARVALAPPGWCSLPDLAARDPGAAWSYHGAAFGFPARSSTREALHDGFIPTGAGAAGGWSLIGADLAHTSVSSYGTSVRRVRTVGLLVNTLLYAAVIATVIACVEVVRVAHRRRRGRCAWCGYDRSGLSAATACPECGAGSAAFASNERSFVDAATPPG